jgi:glycosyltransferase involved in cell wall biosynthesis
MPLVSVCVPVYNGEKYIKKTLETIINQTWRDFELIISDDGSKDNTLAIIQEFNDDRIIINRNPVNLGQAGNINKLIELAQGEYIAIYHADDLYEPDILEKEVNFLNKHPEAVAVFAMYDQIDSKDNKINEVRLPEKVSSKDAFNMDEAIDIK